MFLFKERKGKKNASVVSIEDFPKKNSTHIHTNKAIEICICSQVFVDDKYEIKNFNIQNISDDKTHPQTNMYTHTHKQL